MAAWPSRRDRRGRISATPAQASPSPPDGTRCACRSGPARRRWCSTPRAGRLARGWQRHRLPHGPHRPAPRLPVAPDWRNSNRPRLGQVPLRMGAGEFARSLALLPEDRASCSAPTTICGSSTPAAGRAARCPARRRLGPGGGRRDRRCGAWRRHAALVPRRRRRAWSSRRRCSSMRTRCAGCCGRRRGCSTMRPMAARNWSACTSTAAAHQTPEWASFRQAYRALYAPAAVRARGRRRHRAGAGTAGELGDVRARIGRLPHADRRHRLRWCRARPAAPWRWESRTLPDGATRAAARLRRRPIAGWASGRSTCW